MGHVHTISISQPQKQTTTTIETTRKSVTNSQDFWQRLNKLDELYKEERRYLYNTFLLLFTDEYSSYQHQSHIPIQTTRT